MIQPTAPHPPSFATGSADSPLPPPSLRRRLACWLYEGVLLFGVVFVASLLFSVVTQTRHGLQNRPELQAFLFLLLGLYFTWCWTHSHTLPMRTWHIRIQGPDGRPPSPGRALRRYLLSWIWLLPPLALGSLLALQGGRLLALTLGWVGCWAALSYLHPKRQFWHDAWAGTELVFDPSQPVKAGHAMR